MLLLLVAKVFRGVKPATQSFPPPCKAKYASILCSCFVRRLEALERQKSERKTSRFLFSLAIREIKEFREFNDYILSLLPDKKLKSTNGRFSYRNVFLPFIFVI